MSYTQVRSFNQSMAGKVVGDCLRNERLGFNIPSKYLDAWAAWENTDQHTEAIPAGVDVCLFYSYDGPTNGHTNVRLANGQVWSDGVVYASLATFEASHTPKYVGWSTHLNDVAVIEETSVPAPSAQTINLPASSGAWHLYKPGGPYNPNVPADYIAVVHPAEYAPGGLTYPIVANVGDGVYRVQSPSHGVGDLWTKGSSVVIK